MRRFLCFRFDVDSHRCLGHGTRALTAVAAHLGVPFTFYVNMGRATDRRILAREVLAGVPPAAGLTSRRKLGLAATLTVLARNPEVGARRPGEILRLHRLGHEVGLHGGRNHRTWQDRAMSWSPQQVADEVIWGQSRLVSAGVPSPVGFAPPAWVTPPGLSDLLVGRGFRYLADVHDATREGVDRDGPLPRPITNLVGEPGGVGYLEWLRSQGADDDAVVADFRARLDGVRSLAVVYDHPFWAGSHDARMVARLVEAGLDAGFTVATLGEAVDELTPSDGCAASP